MAQHEQDNERLRRAQLLEAVGQVLEEKQPLPINDFFRSRPLYRTLMLRL